MKYIKFNEKGFNPIEAPKVMKTESGTIFGYNNEKNEERLLADGWLKYEGDAPLNRLKFENGKIVEMPSNSVEKEERTIFTKLEIRRALRKLGQEKVLNDALKIPQFKADWYDAQEIDLNDEMMQTAITSGFITSGLLNDLVKELN